jgi:hypothetical protein
MYDDTGMKRQSGLALSMLIVSLWMGQTALTESGLLSVAWGVACITLTCLSGAILSGVSEPEAIPDEELSPLASRILIAMLLTCVILFLLLIT